MAVKVKNHQGHYESPNDYESWLDFWEKNMGKKADQCSNLDCRKRKYYDDDLVGGHVDSSYGNIYIVPICQECNNQGSYYSFDVDERNLLPF